MEKHIQVVIMRNAHTMEDKDPTFMGYLSSVN
jgi:hypothetical protein